MAPVTSVQLYEKMKSKSPLCMRVESICHIFNLNNLQSLFSYLSEPFSCKNLASFGLYHHTLEKKGRHAFGKRCSCYWWYKNAQHGSHRKRGTPEYNKENTTLVRKAYRVFISLKYEVIFFFLRSLNVLWNLAMVCWHASTGRASVWLI